MQPSDWIIRPAIAPTTTLLMVTISRDTLLLTGGLALGAGIYYLFNKKEKERRESNSARRCRR